MNYDNTILTPTSAWATSRDYIPHHAALIIFLILRRNFEVTYYDFTKVAFYKLCISKMISFHQHQSKAMAYKPLNSFPNQCQRDGRKPGKVTGSRLCCFCFCLSGYYHYLPTVQIKPFRPNPSYSVTESHSFRYSAKIFSRPSFAGGARSFFFFTGFRTLSRRSSFQISGEGTLLLE